MVYIRRRILVFVFYVVFQITEKLIKRSSSQEFTLADLTFIQEVKEQYD
jgi:hypothetical protein